MFPPPRPWKQVVPQVDPEREYVAFASRFYLKSLRRVPGFMLHSLRVMKQLDRSPGIVAWAMAADIPKLQFHTISVWANAEDLRNFNHAGDHEVALTRFADAMKVKGTFSLYQVRGRDLPISWPDVIAHIDRQVIGR